MAKVCPKCNNAEMISNKGISRKTNKPFHRLECPICRLVEWDNTDTNNTQQARVVDNRPEPTPQPIAKVPASLSKDEIKFLVEISRDLVVERMRQQGGSDSVLPADFLINTFERLKEIYSV